MENVCPCVVQSSFNIPDDAARWRLEFFGDEGRIIGDTVLGQVDGGSVDALFLGRQQGYDAQRDKKNSRGKELEIDFGDMYARELESFSRSILSGAPVEVPGCEAVQVQRVLEAACRSDAEGRVVTP